MLVSALEEELSEIFEKVRLASEEKNLSLQEIYDLYFLAKEKYLAVKKEERAEKLGDWMLAIFFLTGKFSENFITEWQSSKFTPTTQELELLKKGCNEVMEAFDGYLKPNLLAHRYRPYDIHRAETKEKISKIRELIRQEESAR